MKHTSGSCATSVQSGTNGIANILKEAIANARAIPTPNGNYFSVTCRQRQPGDELQCGSRFTKSFLLRKSDGKVESVAHRLFEDHIGDWVEYPDCPNLMTGCKAYRLDWSKTDEDGTKRHLGYLGIIDLKELEPTAEVTIDDRKGTGMASVVYKGIVPPKPVDFAVAIVGDEQGKQTLFTVHPGDPVTPSRIKVDETWKHGKVITVAQALKAGFETAKVD